VIVDFHSHTYESDGTLSPQALADFMGERSVEIFSISDHDTLSAYGKFETPPGARVVTGIEINTTWAENEVHVLGYGVRLDDAPLIELVNKNRSAREVRAQRMVDQLRAVGYSITIEDVNAEAIDAKAIGRPHVAKALINLGQIPDIDYAFRHLLTSGKPGFVPSLHVTPDRAIAAIKAAGGVPVLAHPGRLKDRSLIEEFVGYGLQGLEVFYPRHDSGDVAQFRETAKRHNLVMTAGCDFHDIRYHKNGVGMEVDAADLAPFFERVL
jgi:3',5'-nucleoside bisphosphate phosphatase